MTFIVLFNDIIHLRQSFKFKSKLLEDDFDELTTFKQWFPHFSLI